MAIYGDEFYGISSYGTDTLVDFDVSPFRVTSIDYNKIFVEWNVPTGDWDLLRLVRNGFGFPMTPDDGDLLFEGSNSSDVRTYLDEGQVPNNTGLIEGRTYYYTIFVRETTTRRWISAGTNLGVSVINYGTADLMYEYLPAVYKIGNPYAAEVNDSEINQDLYGFLQIFAFEHDLFKTTTANMKNRYDPLTLDGRLIPLLLNQFGFAFEREIGIQQARNLLQNAIKIYSERGSLSGVATFVTAFSGFNAEVLPPVNLMLDYNNSTFKETLGFWEAILNDNPEFGISQVVLGDLADITISRASASTEDPSVDPYFEPNSPSNFPNFTDGFMKIVADTDGDALIECGSSAPMTRGIPVNAGTQYVFSAYIFSRDTAREVVTNVKWYDRFGQLISTAGETSTTTVVGEWYRTSSATGSAPENAYYAVPQIRILSCVADEIHYVDAAQFEVGAEPTTYVDARRIDVVLRANRINQVLNPSFEESLGNWYFENGTAERVEDGAVNGSSYSAKITAATDSYVSAFSVQKVPVTSGDQNALSGYFKGTPGSTANLSIAWYDQSDVLLSISVTPVTALTLDEWSRIEFTAVSPDTAVTAAVTVTFDPASAGAELYADAILFEKASFVVPYFDGGGAGYEQLGDVIWEGGDPTNGRSHYYKNRAVVTKRLFEVLPDYIPTGSPWAVLVAQPD